jgi:dienelactone hydrolase
MRSYDAEKARVQSTWVDHIPVLWTEPRREPRRRQLIVFLPNLCGTKEQVADLLQELAAEGFVALSFDPWQHGERGTESRDDMVRRVFGAFRKHMWPILGQTTLDTLRVLDWAVATLGVEPACRIGGLSMGGDVAVAVAGVDRRVERVVSVVATPDWLRPGMHDAFEPDTLVDQGTADAYAQFFYDQLNPLTHLAGYAHGPAITFYNGGNDTHVPPDGALRFQAALRPAYPSAANNVSVRIVQGLAHMDVRDRNRWWPECRRGLTRA